MALITVSKKELLSLSWAELTDDELSQKITDLGMPVESITDSEISVDVTPNRPDMFSVEGLARALSSFAGVKAGLRSYSAKDSGITVTVDKSVKKIRPFIVAAAAKNLKLDEPLLKSLVALQEKLHDTVGRKRRKVSMGFTDLDKLKPPFTYKAVKLTEGAFIPLDFTEMMTPGQILETHPKGKDYGYILEGHKRCPLITDSEGTVVAMPPIITAESVKITPSTKNIFIDITGTSEQSIHDCLKIVCCALADRGAEIRAVTISRGATKLQTPDFSPIENSVSLGRINKLLGSDFDAEEAKEYLERMGHGIELGERKGRLKVLSPPYRIDILHEVDITEDVAIPYGYNNFAPTLPQFTSIGKQSDAEAAGSAATEIMLGMGFNEILAPYITSKETNFTKPLLGEHPAIHIKNPLTVELTMFRTWCIPSLLEILAANKDEKMPQKIFELGHAAGLEAGKPLEKRKLAAAACGPKACFSEIRSVLEALLLELGMKCEFGPLEKHPTFIQGRAAEILRDGKPIGVFGEIHPQVLNNFGIEQPVAAFEIELG